MQILQALHTEIWSHHWNENRLANKSLQKPSSICRYLKCKVWGTKLMAQIFIMKLIPSKAYGQLSNTEEEKRLYCVTCLVYGWYSITVSYSFQSLIVNTNAYKFPLTFLQFEVNLIPKVLIKSQWYKAKYDFFSNAVYLTSYCGGVQLPLDSDTECDQVDYDDRKEDLHPNNKLDEHWNIEIATFCRNHTQLHKYCHNPRQLTSSQWKKCAVFSIDCHWSSESSP